MNDPILIEIPDVSISGTVLKRKAELHTMVYNQTSKSLVLNWIVTYYTDSNGTYGEELTEKGISKYNIEQIANDSVMVDPLTGNIYENGTHPENAIGQYTFFYNLAENENINVHQLIRNYGSAASW